MNVELINVSTRYNIDIELVDEELDDLIRLLRDTDTAAGSYTIARRLWEALKAIQLNRATHLDNLKRNS